MKLWYRKKVWRRMSTCMENCPSSESNNC